MIDPYLLDSLYDAAARPELIPMTLHDLAVRHGARGGVLFHASGTETAIAVSPGAENLFERYVAEGHMQPNERGSALFLEQAPRFRTDSDFWTAEQRVTMPVYRDLLIPMNFAVGAGTVIQGTDDDMVGLTLEGFASDAMARRQLPLLDRIRPTSPVRPASPYG